MLFNFQFFFSLKFNFQFEVCQNVRRALDLDPQISSRCRCLEAARAQTQPVLGVFVEVLGRLFFLGEPYRHLTLIITFNFRSAATCHLQFINLIGLASTYQCGRNLWFGDPIYHYIAPTEGDSSVKVNVTNLDIRFPGKEKHFNCPISIDVPVSTDMPDLLFDILCGICP